MKIVNAPAEPQNGSRPPAPVAVADALQAIDVSSLDRLIAIRQDQDRLHGFREKAEGKKSAVSAAVYKRVMEDYAQRSSALEEQSVPLREQARAEYQKLKQVTEEVARRRDQAQLEKDELEFRHEVGELTDEEIGEKLRGPVGMLEQCTSEQTQVDTLYARFIEALGSPDALEHEPEPPTEERTPIPAEDRPTSPASPSLRMAAALVASNPRKKKGVDPAHDVYDDDRPTPIPTPAAAAPPPAPAPAPDPEPDDDFESATVVVSRTDPRLAQRMRDEPRTDPRFTEPKTDPRMAEATQQMAPRPAAVPPPPQPMPQPMPPAMIAEADEPDSAATMMLATAAIVLIEPASASQEYQLATINGIGRSDENHICLLHAGISRKHAVIKAVPGGFSIKDLGSQNGTFVNGQRITEKALSDGDTIAIGSVRFVFRMPWSPSQTATAGRMARAGGKR